MKVILEKSLRIVHEDPENQELQDMTATVSLGGTIYLYSEDEKFHLVLSAQEINIFAAMLGLNLRR